MIRHTFISAALLSALFAPVVSLAQTVVKPTGSQDGEIWQSPFWSPGNPYLDTTLTMGRWGTSDGKPIHQIGIHTFPPGADAANIGGAFLRIPQADVAWEGSYCLSLNWVITHIDVADDTQVTVADATSAALSLIGSYRAAGPYVPDNSRIVELNVTSQVKADLNADRATFAWRLEPQESGFDSTYSARYFPTTENTDGAFPLHGAELVLYPLGIFEDSCTDGIDNNNNGLIDCADPFCTDDPGCPEICDDAIDNDADGQVDCADAECLGSPACPETICNDGLDNDADGLTDCDDPDCSSSAACPEDCTDDIDNDANGLVDCADPDCDSSFLCAGQEAFKPAGSQDGEIWQSPFWAPGTPYLDTSLGTGRWGTSDGLPINQIGIHTLPMGVTSSFVGSAVLRIPQPDIAWDGNYCLSLNWVINHIDAANDETVTLPDATSSALSPVGLYRVAGPYVPDSTRIVELNVTAQVKVDLDAGRATFAWRLEPEETTLESTYSARYFPTVENGDAAFPLHGAELVLYASGFVEDNCTDGIDNDNNGLIDCADPFCTNDPACPEICNDGIDNDADGDVDCADSECLGSPACPEAICFDGTDNDEDGLTDCADSDCFGSASCRSESGYCNDSYDNDVDCLVDHADPDCRGEIVVRPRSPQDGDVAVGLSNLVISDYPFARFGKYDGAPWYSLGMHTLPANVNPADVIQAKLRIPQVDSDWLGEPSVQSMTFTTVHIDAADDNAVTAADASSSALDIIGLYRGAGPLQQQPARFVQYEVTDLVKADMSADRATFAWRIEPQGSLDAVNSLLFFPSVDDTSWSPSSNRSTLILRIAGQFESDCDDGVDNEGDGLVDCADSDCYSSSSDPVPACQVEICGDAVDNEGDGFADCDDADCLLNACCEIPQELCANGSDDDNDTLIDCGDPDCRCAPNCGPYPAEACHNGIDDDCDKDSDCVDADCVNHPSCLNCLDPFADLDGDSDVDQTDFGQWQRCFSTGGGVVRPGCECLDRDASGLIDANDLDAFLACAHGPAVPIDPGCDDN